MAKCAKCGGELGEGASQCPSCGQPIATKSQSSGVKAMVWIIGGCGCATLLLLVPIVAAILIPNFLDALQKARVKRTVVDLGALMEALEQHRAEHGVVPSAGSIDELASALEPTAGAPLPRTDGWKQPLRYECVEPLAEGCGSYRLGSPTRDGVFDRSSLADYPVSVGRAEIPLSYDGDLIAGDGAFWVLSD